MTPERWQHIKSLLLSALERDTTDRAAFLAAACAGDPTLRKEVENLLAAHEQAGTFIESPAFELMASSLENQTESLAGRTFGHYQIISALGVGGMGEVYLAEDKRLGRKIALKVLPGHYTADDERVRRFQQEARAASALNHPGIITIYEIAEIDSRHFIATEFIEGETLRRRLSKTPIEIIDALDIAAHTASALAAAHTAGIVHRDIKPENIMLREDGIVKVLDFGLAKLTDPQIVAADTLTLVKTEQGMVMGTSYYMSPEQARGLAVDARTDIWSLGVVIYEMVVGRPPFEGATASDVIASILQGKTPPLTKSRPNVPAELEWIVEKTLRKDRDERYQTIKELLTDLRNLKRRVELDEFPSNQRTVELPPSKLGTVEGTHDTEPASERQTEAIAPSRSGWVSRKTTAIGALGVIVGLAIVGYLWVQRPNPTTKELATAVPSFTQLTYQPGPEFFPSLSPDGKSLAYASRTTGNWDIYVQRVGGANPINLTPNSPADDSQPAFSPDGAHCFSIRAGRRRYLLNGSHR